MLGVTFQSPCAYFLRLWGRMFGLFTIPGGKLEWNKLLSEFLFLCDTYFNIGTYETIRQTINHNNIGNIFGSPNFWSSVDHKPCKQHQFMLKSLIRS